MGELNVVGGHVALDLVNTVDPRVPGRSDGNEHLGSPDELLSWALRVALLTADEGEQVRTAWRATDRGARAHAATLELREAVYVVMLAELGATDDARAALDVLVQRWADAVGRSSLALTPGDTGDRLRVGPDPASSIPDRLAHAAVDLVRELDVRQLKTCPLDDGGCGWLFLDRSRNGSRRWCSMDDCGARAKARRLTARRRSARARPRSDQA